MIFELMYAEIGTNTSLSQQVKRFADSYVWKMRASKNVFRPPKSAEEERRLLEDCFQKLTRDSTKWAYKIFNDWQIGRRNKDASLESCLKSWTWQRYIQLLDTNIVKSSNRITK